MGTGAMEDTAVDTEDMAATEGTVVTGDMVVDKVVTEATTTAMADIMVAMVATLAMEATGVTEATGTTSGGGTKIKKLNCILCNIK